MVQRPPTARTVLAALFACSALALYACGDRAPDRDAPGVLVRDSSGVRIVENLEPEWAEGEGWRLSERPVRTLGAESDGEPLLFGVRDAEVLSDGSVAVVNGGTAEVIVYDAAGRPELVLGGRGEGPGEFSSPGRIFSLRADSIMVLDFTLRRLTVFAPDGTLGGVTSVPTEVDGLRFPEVGLSLAGGDLLVASVMGDPRAGVIDYVVVLLTRSNEVASVFDPLPGLECGDAEPISGTECSIGWFQPYATFAAGDSAVFYGYPKSYEILELGADGRLVRIVRRRAELLPITDLEIDRIVDRLAADLDREPESLRARLEHLRVPETMPAYEKIMTDDLGYLWVADYVSVVPVILPIGGRFRREELTPWSVFDPTGRWLGTVSVPSNLDVMHIAEDAIVGVMEDDFDVETVQIFALTR